MELVSVKGPGVAMVLNDSKKYRPGAPMSIQTLLVIHDADINKAVSELRAAGAEAISINNQRLTAMSAVREMGSIIYVNNTPQTPPYVIRAIGDSTRLRGKLNLPGGIVQNLRRQDPAMIGFRDEKILKISAYSGAAQSTYAMRDR